MCGIIGHLAFQKNMILPEDIVRRLNRMQEHRGPDGEGVYLKDEVALASRRLAVIDLDRAHQPMISADGRYALVFNGEIYNYRELRQELLQTGHVFSTNSDTEVLLHWYRQQGPAGLGRLNGMFAFAVWDNQTKELFLARDRMGVKPLYYAADQRRFLFSSELTAIHRSGLWDWTWDYEAISDYLAYWYICEPRTIIKEIKQLPPGHYAFVRSGRIQIAQWWQIPSQKEDNISFGEASKTLEGLLDDAVNIRLQADVPVGLFLSGGIDSGLIGSFAAQQGKERLKAFSIGFKEKTYDELPEAQCTAEKLGMDFHPFYLNALTPDDIEQAVTAFDEPLGNASFLPLYFLAKAARQDVAVVLSGDGGDELFGGYPTYQAPYYLRGWQQTPGFMRALVRYGIGRLPVNHGRISLDYRLKQLMKGIDLPYPRGHYTWRQVMGLDMQAVMFDPQVWAKIGSHDPFDITAGFFHQAKGLGLHNQAMYADLNTYLLNDHLRKLDRMTMAHGLEARLPFMDHRIVEFAARLPQEHKVSFWQTKIILRKMARSRLPERVINAGKKGLTPPIAHWISQDLKDYFETALEGGLVGELFRPQAIKNLWREHHCRHQDHSRILWGLIVLNIWVKSLKLSYAEHSV